MAVSTTITLNTGWISEMERSGDVLWIRQAPGDLVALSLKDLSPLKPEDAGRPPLSLDPYDPEGFGGLLGGDATGVWLAADHRRIARLNDDGASVVRNFHPLVAPRSTACQAAVTGQFLFLFWHGRLWRLSPTDDRIRSLRLGDPGLSRMDALHVGERIWLRLNYGADLLTMDLDFGNPSTIPPAAKDGWNYLTAVGRESVAVSNDLFALAHHIGLLKVSPGGKVSRVTSFEAFFRQWFKRQFGREPAQHDVQSYSYGRLTVAGGRLLWSLKPTPERLTLWLYDPTADHWTDTTVDSDAYPLPSAPSMAVAHDGTVSMLTPEGMKTLARVPASVLPIGGGDTQALLTNRFLYVRTSHGILRVQRAGGR